MSKACEWAQQLLEAKQALDEVYARRPAISKGYCTGFGKIGFQCSDEGWPVLMLDPNVGSQIPVQRHEFRWADDIDALKRQCRWVLDIFGEPEAKDA